MSSELKENQKNEKENFKVQYSGDAFEIKDFLRFHPGGLNYVAPYENKEISKQMQNSYHSPAAYYLLRDYGEKGRDSSDKIEGNEDLEKLVDWDKAMLCQVGKLGTKYHQWIESPVDRPLRLFTNQLLENLTLTPWYVVPMVWIPIIAFFFHCGYNRYASLTNDEMPLLTSIFYLCVGVLLWTWVEYSLHRWVFHMEVSGKYTALIYIHFAIHGLHHKVPFDKKRLVFPPVPAAFVSYLMHKLLIQMLFPPSLELLILAGALLGYLMYDMTHFYIHYGAPRENSYFYHMKRYHNQHHFGENVTGYGISSVIWDKLFGTTIALRKLAKEIRW